MNFEEAIRAIDMGKTVRMAVNPEKMYRLASDGETIVSKPIYESWADGGNDWRSAIFFTRHVRGEWEVMG